MYRLSCCRSCSIPGKYWTLHVLFVHKNVSTLKIANNPVLLVSVSLICAVLFHQTHHRGLWGNTNTAFIRLLLTGEAFPGPLLSLSASLSFSLPGSPAAQTLFKVLFGKKNPRQHYTKVNNVRAEFVCKCVCVWM